MKDNIDIINDRDFKLVKTINTNNQFMIAAVEIN